MTDRELMQQALDALESDCGATKFGASEALRARLAQPEPEPVAWVAYENGEKHGIDFDEDEIAELPVGTMLYPIPPNFLDPAKVARLMDEAFERGKKEIDMEQVKDIAQKLADCALLNSAPPQPKQEPVAWMYEYGTDHGDAVNQIFWHKNLRLEKPTGLVRNVVPLYTAPPQRGWQGLTDEDWIIGKRSADYIAGAEWAEAKLKEKNT